MRNDKVLGFECATTFVKEITIEINGAQVIGAFVDGRVVQHSIITEVDQL